MNKILSVFIIALVMNGCANNENKNNNASGDAGFQKLSDEFLAAYLGWNPQTAVTLGLHEYDGKVTDYSKASLDSELNSLKLYDEKFAAIDTASLSTKIFYDYRILRLAIKKEIFSFEDLKDYSSNPMTYAGAIDVNTYIKQNYAPLEERLKYIISVERDMPNVFAAAKANLADTLAKPLVETAMDIAKGSADFLKGDLLVALKDVKNDSLMTVFKQTNNTAINELNGFAAWLEKEKLPKANNKYAIGKENYRKMLFYSEDITMDPENILAIGLAELKREQDAFNAAAKIIDPSKKPIDVYHDMQKEHPSADSLLPDARKHLEMIRQYLIDKKIVTMPSEVRVQVKETPQYGRSTSTASMDMPGPFEQKATEAYYYITPVESSWTSTQKEDWLAMFNYYTTDNVSIHEAYPGHYTQGLHLNASSATKIEKIFGSYAFIEGWAHYCEKMMVDEGFGNNGDPVTAAKYRMAQSGDALLRLCRLCVSVKMHCEGMSVDDGTKFFMDNWYQGEKPSRQEALRGTFDPGYLFYTVGKLEILKLREDYQKEEGSNFSLMKFHDMVLDNGMPTIRLLREIMIKDKSKWDEIL